MLRLYSIFHLNLAYSSIPESARKEVIKQCYWPLLRLATEEGIPLAIEAPAYTLEVIADLEPLWIDELKKATKANLIEFVGSGYTQLIAPLVPALVNTWNLRIGREIYGRLLGRVPGLWYINEQAYSSGLVEHYAKLGAKAVIMEWNNPRKYHPEWDNEWRYFPQEAAGSEGYRVPVVWADSIAFQKFQRYAHGETDLEDYLAYLRSHDNGAMRFFPLYANDTEIFDYRPNRYHTEPSAAGREWEKIRALFVSLKQDRNLMLVRPSDILEGLRHTHGNHCLSLESAEQPIPVKKQEKYNINRWALSGRNDLGINTKCYQIYHAMKQQGSSDPDDWKELCFLWSSDFRTHITPQRWKEFLTRLRRFHKTRRLPDKALREGGRGRPLREGRETAFHYRETRGRLILETDLIKCVFNKLKGLAIDAFWVKPVSPLPLFGTIPHGYYDDISLGADFFSGHLIIEKPGEHKITDLHACAPRATLRDGSTIVIRYETNHGNLRTQKEYRIPLDNPSLQIRQSISMRRELATVHPMHVTLLPGSFDNASLFYATHNGGYSLERFEIGGQAIHHAQSLSSLVSAKQGLGATGGMVIIGDKEKHVVFRHDRMKSAVIPSIYFLPVGEHLYFLRLQYSAQELDETFVENEKDQRMEFHWELDALSSA